MHPDISHGILRDLFLNYHVVTQLLIEFVIVIDISLLLRRRHRQPLSPTRPSA